MKNNRSKSKVTLVSDNTAYQPYTVNASDIVEIWKACMVISKTNVQPRWDVNQLANVVSSLQDQVANLKNKLN